MALSKQEKDLSAMALHRRRQNPREQSNQQGSANTVGPNQDVGEGKGAGRIEKNNIEKQLATPEDAKDAKWCLENIQNAKENVLVPSRKGNHCLSTQPPQTFYVTKFAILRLIGCVYLIAFMGAYHQNRGLMGSNGLVPAHRHMNQLFSNFDDDAIGGFLAHPSMFWIFRSKKFQSFSRSLNYLGEFSDWHLDATAMIGATLSFLVVLGLDSWWIMVALWLLDFSIVTAAEGNSFYAYGWESQLLETGFLAIWLCDIPFLPSAKHPKSLASPPSIPILYLFRYLTLRISLGAGLIKLRGDICWQNKTCLYHHFETQPIPSPMSFLFRFLPKGILRRAVDLDYFVQLYSSWMVMVPGFSLGNGWLISLRRWGGWIQAGFMVNIILSGNFAFLNHLTIIPALACLDDACFPKWIKNFVYRKIKIGEGEQKQIQTNHAADSAQSAFALSTTSMSSSTLYRRYSILVRTVIDLCLVALIFTLSLPVLSNLLQIGGKHQVMNASFNSFRLVNTYGAFGSVGEKRYEAILSVSDDGISWIEIEFPCKPGNIRRRPCFCAPYHYRLDWNIWFLGFKPHQGMLQRREQWLFSLMHKILSNDGEKEQPWLALLDESSRMLLKDSSKKYAKVDMYRYEMADPLLVILKKWMAGKDVVWWKRFFEESLIQPVMLDQTTGRLMYANT